MFHNRCLDNKINSIYERALTITYQDHISSFQDLLNKSKSFSIIFRNFQVLATEKFKIYRILCPDILREIFVLKINSYNICRNNTFERRQVHSVYYGTESLSFLSPKIWGLVSMELKKLERLDFFKLKIKKWIPFEFLFRLCQAYIQRFEFLWSSKADHDHCYYHCHLIIYVVYTIIYMS